MITNPAPLTAAEVLLLCGLAFCAVLLLARRRRLPFPALVGVALLASAVVTAPFTAYGVVGDVRAARVYSPFMAERIGPESNGLDTTVVDRIAAKIPLDATFAIVIAPNVPGGIGPVFHDWAITFLLPRVAVSNPASADWVVSLGAPPSRFGLRPRTVELVASSRGPTENVWVGELR